MSLYVQFLKKIFLFFENFLLSKIYKFLQLSFMLKTKFTKKIIASPTTRILKKYFSKKDLLLGKDLFLRKDLQTKKDLQTRKDFLHKKDLTRKN